MTAARPTTEATAPSRYRAVDWLRGIAVLFMIQCHAMTLLRKELLRGPLFGTLNRIDGLVAPAFLLAAGFSISLVQGRSAGLPFPARLDRLKKTARRVGEVLAVATLVNWMWFPIFREPRWIFRLDILQCIGATLSVTLPLLFALAPRPRLLQGAVLALGLGVFAAAPLGETVRGPLAALANHSTESVFPLLPWAGYVFFGAALGTAAAAGGARGLVRWTLVLGALGGAAWAAEPVFLAVYPPHQFYVTDPANHGKRLTFVCALLSLLLGLERRWPGAWQQGAVVRFLEVFGTSSLAAYFFHETLLYYRLFRVLSFNAFFGGRCGWGLYALLTVILIAMTYALTRVTDRTYRALRG